MTFVWKQCLQKVTVLLLCEVVYIFISAIRDIIATVLYESTINSFHSKRSDK
jgi:hypothetical protein